MYDDLVQSLGATAYYKGNDASGAPVNALAPGTQVTSASGLTYRQTRVLPGKGPNDQAAVSMSGGGDIQLPKAAVSSLTGPFSIALWMSFATPTTSGTGQIVAFCADVSGSRNGFTMNSEFGMNQISFTLKDSTTTPSASFGVVPGYTLASDGSEMHFLCITLSGLSSGSTLRGFVDATTNSAALTTSVTISSNPLHIGTADDTFWQKLTGRVGNIALWNRAITATEAGILYRAGLREGVTY